jgi:hypothetical protein
MIRIGVRSFVAGGGNDADAQAFIDAAAITDVTQQSAINTLVLDLKNYGIWTKMKAIYPFCGGTASSHKWNLKDARDLDAAFRLVFTGGWTHSSNGALPNGTNGYADTFYTPSTSGQLNSAHLSYYSRSTTGVTLALIGCNNGGAPVYRHVLGISATAVALNTTTTTSYTPASSAGFHMVKRETSTEIKLVYNGVAASPVSMTTDGRPNVAMVIGARRSGASITNFSALQCAFASIGDGLTDTEAANLYTAVQAYQTTLSRNV